MTRIAAARLPDNDLADNPRAVIGSNRPPVDEMARIDFNEAIDKHDGVRARIAQLIDSSTRAVATNDEEAGRCAELIRQMGAVEKVVEDERTAVKGPYLLAGRAIDDAAKALVKNLVDAKAKVRSTAEDYMREKQRKIDEANRRRQYAESIMDHIRQCGMGLIGGKTYPFPILIRELEEKVVIDSSFGDLEQPARALLASTLANVKAAFERHLNKPEEPAVIEPLPEPAYVAPAPKAEPVQVRSDFGAVMSGRKVKVAVIVDQLKAYKAVKSVPVVQEAIQKAVNGLVRAGQTNIPGVEIREDVGLNVR